MVFRFRMSRLSVLMCASSSRSSAASPGVVLIGLFVGLFSSTTGSLAPLVGLGLLYGSAFGIVWGLVGHALTRGRRDFISRQQLLASRYDVLCELSVFGVARRILGVGVGWPPAEVVADSSGDNVPPTIA